MRRMRLLILGVMLTSCMTAWGGSPPASLSLIPKYINYQGRLVAPDGEFYSNTTHTIELRLYNTASGSSPLWGAQYTVETHDGYFSVLLGSASGVPVGDAPTNELWRVFWKQDGSSPDEFFMSVKVLTDADGEELPEPVEANPRQQFVTSPFAMRAHQSKYASASTDAFDAPQGVLAPSVTSTSGVSLVCAGGEISMAADGSVEIGVPQNKDLTIRGEPIFAYESRSQTFAAGATQVQLKLQMDTAKYDVFVTEWYCSEGIIKGIRKQLDLDYKWVIDPEFAQTPARSGTLYVKAIGFRRGLTDGL